MYDDLTTSIIAAISERKDVDPSDLEVVLAEHVDLHAIEQLAKHETSTWQLEFELPEHTVSVTSDGGVLVDGQETQTQPTD
ncbi:HalOD1 output domain-containing protein [Halorubrum halophilum]|uniref:HalOD1 output domain-containing protein n=1 Tax=Halorubrum halophilum TaxID=413816 RepID=UPI00186B3BCE|nr:HalOD1 output domain-containing protein [Halorubrum halophilum]